MSKELSVFEKYCYHRTQLKLNPGICLAVKLNVLPLLNDIERSLRVLINEIEELSYSVDNLELRWKVLPELKLEQITEYCDLNFNDLGQDVNDYLFKNYHRFKSGSPLWRLIIFPSSKTLALLVDHTLFDGISMSNFWHRFLNALNDKTPSDINSRVKDSLECIWTASWQYRLKRHFISKLFQWFPNSTLQVDPNLFRLQHYTFPASLIDQSKQCAINDNFLVSLSMPPNHLSGLLTFCHEHGFTLSSLIVALTVQELKSMTSDRYSIKCEIPINLRPWIAAKEFGNAVAAFSYNFRSGMSDDSQDMDLIDIATTFHKHSKAMSSTWNGISQCLDELHLLDAIDIEKFCQAKVYNVSYPSNTFELSNLGYQDFNHGDKNGLYQVEDAIFIQPQSLSSLFTCNVISTPKGGLRISLNGPSEMREILNAISVNITNYLDNKLSHLRLSN